MKCALFADHLSLWLYLGGVEFDVSDPEVSLEKSSSIPFVRSPRIWRSDRLVFKRPYWAQINRESSPADDFIGLVCETTRSADERLRSMLRWRAG